MMGLLAESHFSKCGPGPSSPGTPHADTMSTAFMHLPERSACSPRGPAAPLWTTNRTARLARPVEGHSVRTFTQHCSEEPRTGANPNAHQQEKEETHCGFSTLGGKADQLPTQTATRGPSPQLGAEQNPKAQFPCYEV